MGYRSVGVYTRVGAAYKCIHSKILRTYAHCLQAEVVDDKDVVAAPTVSGHRRQQHIDLASLMENVEIVSGYAQPVCFY